jgi:uracil-DNA glycosylase
MVTRYAPAVTTLRKSDRIVRLRLHVDALHGCRDCPDMTPPVVTGLPVVSPVMLVGQAPGVHEGPLGRPFAWTAGKTMFGWFQTIGIGEAAFRNLVYMAAVCRCFPGKDPKATGGDRVPSIDEVARCSRHLAAEVALVQPRLVLPVGKLAITQLGLLAADKQLVDVVGKQHRLRWHGKLLDVIPLPHPSGASTWHRTLPGKDLLARALALIDVHPAWREIVARAPRFESDVVAELRA